MIFLIEGKYLYGCSSDLSKIYEIRRKVFVDEYFFTENAIIDGLDSLSIHALISVSGKILGCGRITFDGYLYTISQIAILKEERNNGYGDFLVRMLLDKGFLLGAKNILVKSKLSAVKFYEKLGFSIILPEYLDDFGVKRVNLEIEKELLCKNCCK